jgi:hypothetical protein
LLTIFVRSLCGLDVGPVHGFMTVRILLRYSFA